MSKGLWGYENRVLTGTLRAGSEVAGLTVANLTTPEGAEFWQTAGAVTSAGGAWFEIDAGSAVDWRLFGLFRTNLTSAATIRWMLGTSAGAADVLDSGALAGTVVAGYGQSVHDAGQTYSARHLRCEIEDGFNPDGYARVPLAFAGPAYEPSRNFSGGGAEEGWENGNRATETRGGTRYVTVGFERRTRSVTYKLVDEAEIYSDVEPLKAQSRLGRNLLFLPYPGFQEGRTAIFGEVQCSPVSIPHTVRTYRAWQANIRERL